MGDGLVFPDKNIVIDAAEAVLDAWYAFMAPEETFADPARAAAALQRLEMAGLSGQVADGTLDPAQARVQACGALLEAALSGSPSSAGSPAPPWLLGAMTESHDPRVRDLGAGMRSASVVMTTEVIAYAQYRLEAKGVPKGAATSLVLAMTRGQRVVDVGVGQAQAIAEGTLDELRKQVCEQAPQNIADVDWDTDRYWSTSKAAKDALPYKPDEVSWRTFKTQHPKAYGVDGEDMFLMWQVLECARRLGQDITLTTSDYHLASAAMRAGICPSVLYSRTERGITASVMAFRQVTVSPAASLAMAAPAASAAGTVAATPLAMRRPAMPFPEAGPVTAGRAYATTGLRRPESRSR